MFGVNRKMKLAKIIIPERYLEHYPKPYKMERARVFYQKYGVLKERIVIDKHTNKLIDGYTSYLVAYENCLKKVEVIKASKEG